MEKKCGGRSKIGSLAHAGETRHRVNLRLFFFLINGVLLPSVVAPFFAYSQLP